MYYPEVTEILGEPVFRRVADIPEPIDIVDVFRSDFTECSHTARHFSLQVHCQRCGVVLPRGGERCIAASPLARRTVVDERHHRLKMPRECRTFSGRRPNDVPQHIDDIVAAKPGAVWLQSGIRNPGAEEAFAKAGIKVSR